MAEVLSQKQIDSLLSALNKSEVSIQDMDANKESKKVRNYDFKSPKKFTKDRIKLLDSVYENFSRAISSYISRLLRYGCEIKVTEIEEDRYNEFINALDNNDVISLLSVTSAEDPTINGNILLQMSKQVAFNIIDRSLGGIGSEDIDKNFTDIELSLYESIVKNLAPRMDDAWRNHIDLTVEFEKSETNPGLIQVIGIDEVVVIIVIEITMKKSQGIMNLCIPTSILEGIFKVFDKNSSSMNRRKDIKHEKHDEEILDSIRLSELDISAVLGQTQVELHDIYNLKIGDVIQLDKDKEADVEIHIGDRVWFEGSLGVSKQNLAVKVNNVCSDTNI